MLIGLGLDIVELPRIEESLQKFGDKFLQRILTEAEVEAAPKDAGSPSRVPYVAARFAAKEAASKALGTGIASGVGFQDMEVSNMPSGAPQLTFRGRAKEICTERGVTSVHISLTHGRDTAAAVVILEK